MSEVMVVDFAVRKAPEYRLATRTMKGSWPGDRAIRSEFEKLFEWTKLKGIRTGKWVFTELDDSETPNEKRRWEVGIEVKGRGPFRGGGGVSFRTLPACTIASVTFNPDQVAARVIYHGMSDWLKFREKSKEYKTTGLFREVYQGNPWSSKRAWESTQVQVPIKKL
jgi:effector-binding domain-containing protein